MAVPKTPVEERLGEGRTGLDQRLKTASGAQLRQRLPDGSGAERVEASRARGFEPGLRHAPPPVEQSDESPLARMIRQLSHREERIVREDSAAAGDDGVGLPAKPVGEKERLLRGESLPS